MKSRIGEAAPFSVDQHVALSFWAAELYRGPGGSFENALGRVGGRRNQQQTDYK
jgi:hypothetical protein